MNILQLDLASTSHGAEMAEFINPTTSNVLPKFLTTEPLATHAASGRTPIIFSNIP